MKLPTKVLLLLILAQVSTCIVMLCLHLASQWIETGYGLTPYISLPLVGAFSLVPYIVYSLWFEPKVPDNKNPSTINFKDM